MFTEKVFSHHFWTLRDLRPSSNKIWTGSSQLLPTCQKENFSRKKNGILLAWKYVFLIIFGPWAERFRFVVQKFPIDVQNCVVQVHFNFLRWNYFSEEIFHYLFSALSKNYRTLSDELPVFYQTFYEVAVQDAFYVSRGTFWHFFSLN